MTKFKLSDKVNTIFYIGRKKKWTKPFNHNGLYMNPIAIGLTTFPLCVRAEYVSL